MTYPVISNIYYVDTSLNSIIKGIFCWNFRLSLVMYSPRGFKTQMIKLRNETELYLTSWYILNSSRIHCSQSDYVFLINVFRPYLLWQCQMKFNSVTHVCTHICRLIFVNMFMEPCSPAYCQRGTRQGRHMDPESLGIVSIRHLVSLYRSRITLLLLSSSVFTAVCIPKFHHILSNIPNCSKAYRKYPKQAMFPVFLIHSNVMVNNRQHERHKSGGNVALLLSAVPWYGQRCS